MLLRRERIVALRPETMMLDVVVLVLAVGHVVERQIGNFGERIVQFFFAAFFFAPPSLGSIPSAPRPRPSSPWLLLRPCSSLASPISFDAALRRACAVSSAMNCCSPLLVERDQPLRLRAASPRRASARSKASGFSRMKRMSCMQSLCSASWPDLFRPSTSSLQRRSRRGCPGRAQTAHRRRMTNQYPETIRVNHSAGLAAAAAAAARAISRRAASRPSAPTRSSPRRARPAAAQATSG